MVNWVLIGLVMHFFYSLPIGEVNTLIKSVHTNIIIPLWILILLTGCISGISNYTKMPISGLGILLTIVLVVPFGVTLAFVLENNFLLVLNIKALGACIGLVLGVTIMIPIGMITASVYS